MKMPHILHGGGFKTKCRNRHFRGISFKMVHVSTNCCITEQQTIAIDKIITVPILFLQSGHVAFAKYSIRATAAMASIAWYNGVNP